MTLQRLSLQDFRNIATANLSFHPQLNVVVGDNGSGKTSILEAIYHLGLGRSFRSNRPSKVIKHAQDFFVLFAQLEDLKVGLKKSKSAETLLKVNGELARSQAELAAKLPVQLLHPDGYGLVDGGPKQRRSYLDWGVFHVEQAFHASWQRYKRLLKQRNALLKQARSYQELSYWDQQLLPLAESLALFRSEYLADLAPLIKDLQRKFLPEFELEVTLERGWDKNNDFADVLKSNYQRDRMLGFTQSGAHKADLKFRLNGKPAADVVSRGQLKLLVCALLLAQGQHLQRRLGKHTTFLIDDFAAELDQHKRCLLAEALQANQAQVFVTAIDQQILDGFNLNDCNMFHVKHGCVSTEEMRVEHV